MGLPKSIIAAVFATGLSVGLAQAETVVKVTLVDKLGTSDIGTSHGLGMGMKADMSKAKMAITANPKAAARGDVRFNVTNLASNLVHEVIIASITDDAQMLAYDESRNKVDEETVRALGSVKELDPNKSASITLNLKPGKYLLYCNIAGHYMAGMWTVVEVK